MQDGDTGQKIKAEGDYSQCVGCHRIIHFNELYGAHGLCSQCLAADLDEHHGA